jgi:transposase
VSAGRAGLDNDPAEDQGLGVEFDPGRVQTLADAQTIIGALLAALTERDARIAQLEQQVATLTARLNQTSQNSSRPPSADPPGPPRRPPKGSRGGRRGAQPGHPQYLRAVVPAMAVTVVDHWPTVCRACQAPLRPESAGEPLCHQVTEVPPIVPVVTEHRRHRVSCPACATTTLAPLPADVPTRAFGPRLQATVALLSGRYRLSRREVAALCADLLGVALCVGSIQRLCVATAVALAAPVAALEGAVRQAPVVHSDETSWKVAPGQRGWLWVVVTTVATLFTIAASRGSIVITAACTRVDPSAILST